MKCLIMKYDAISEKLNEVWNNGFAEEEYGSCQDEGFSAALIITDDMLHYDDLGNALDEGDTKPLIGIITENDQGFVDYALFPTEECATSKWKQQMAHWANLADTQEYD